MRSKNEIPNKTDLMKQYSFNFLLNEKYFSDVVHEKNKEAIKKEVVSDSGKWRIYVKLRKQIKTHSQFRFTF